MNPLPSSRTIFDPSSCSIYPPAGVLDDELGVIDGVTEGVTLEGVTDRAELIDGVADGPALEGVTLAGFVLEGVTLDGVTGVAELIDGVADGVALEGVVDGVTLPAPELDAIGISDDPGTQHANATASNGCVP